MKPSNITEVTRVLYGSETGTAEDVAEKVCGVLSRRGMTCRMDALDDCEFWQLFADTSDPATVLFVVSTTGDGKPPSNMLSFWKYILQKKFSMGILGNLRFSVFGLGDSSYDKYNAAARMLRKRLLQLGAVEFIPVGLGDDQSGFGYIGGFEPWLAQVTEALVPGTNDTCAPELGPEEYVVTYTRADKAKIKGVSDGAILPDLDQLRLISADNISEPFVASVVSNEQLTAPEWSQLVCNVRFRIMAQTVTYNVGDVAVVYPQNPRTLVLRALVAFGLQAEQVYSIRRIGRFGGRRLGRVDSLHCSAEALCTHHLEIAGIPQRSYFELLSFYASDEDEKDKLLELSSGPGTDLYFDYCFREKRNFIDVMEEFSSCCGRVPLHRLLEVLPALKPRQYSIASSPSESPMEIDICVAMVEEITPYKRKRLGTCSNFLCNLRVFDQVNMCIKLSKLFNCEHKELITNTDDTKETNCRNVTIPHICRSPLLMIGPGTGVAPMRAAMRERQYLIDNFVGSDDDCGHAILFFGCRKHDCDFLYRDEWKQSFRSNDIKQHSGMFPVWGAGKNHFVAAFSRDAQPEIESGVELIPGRGKYVTHALEENGAYVWTNVLSQQGSIVYIAGAAKKMPMDVRASIKNILIAYGNFKSDEDAEKYLKLLEIQKRYILDIWS